MNGGLNGQQMTARNVDGWQQLNDDSWSQVHPVGPCKWQVCPPRDLWLENQCNHERGSDALGGMPTIEIPARTYPCGLPANWAAGYLERCNYKILVDFSK